MIIKITSKAIYRQNDKSNKKRNYCSRLIIMIINNKDKIAITKIFK